MFAGYTMFMPDDIQRKMTRFSERSKWKMRQRRNFFFYMSYALFKQFFADFEHGGFIKQQLQRLMHALRGVGGFSCRPVPRHVVRKSQMLLSKFFRSMVGKYGEKFATWKAHVFLHVLDDVTNFACHLDRNSAHIYETFHQNYKRLIHPGPKVYLQLK